MPPVDLRRGMGRTVYGVDLEESPFGGLIETLLTEEELEKLTDGGTPARPGDHPAAPDGGDAEDDGFGDADTETGDAGSDGTGDGSGSDADSWSPSSPPPSTGPDDGRDFGSGAGLGGSGGDDASFLSKHKWLLLKVAVALAALTAVGVVVWRYRDRLAGLVPGRGGDDADEFDVEAPAADAGDGDADVSPARRRAKVGEGTAGTDAGAEGGDRDGDEPDREAPQRRPSRRDDGVETPGQDLDLGALLGLGVLAFVAALVRKYDEERTRPHDPLVDGPLDDDVADDDQ